MLIFFIGARLRLRRREHGLSRGALGEALAVTFQQIQKYEIGMSCVSAGTLYEISKALDVPIGYFFEGYETGSKKGRKRLGG